LLTQDSGLGVSVFYISEDEADTNFSLTPIILFWKTSSWIFVEGFSMVNSEYQIQCIIMTIMEI
jgi:hypothetical protein